MIAHRSHFKDPAYAGRKSAKSKDADLCQREVGPRQAPPGELKHTILILDHKTGQVNRYDTFKSRRGRRKLDFWVNRDAKSRKVIFGKSATWFCRRFLSHLAQLIEIEED